MQFVNWVGRAAVGDFGESYFFKDKVVQPDRRAHADHHDARPGRPRRSRSLISIPLGMLAAVREGTWIDRAVTLVTMIGQAMPSFWLGLILMIVLGL